MITSVSADGLYIKVTFVAEGPVGFTERNVLLTVLEAAALYRALEKHVANELKYAREHHQDRELDSA